MSTIEENIEAIRNTLSDKVTLVAVSKTKPIKAIQEAYDAGQRIFGENKVQEMATKHELLPPDIQWHMIGHLQRNKVKYMAGFVALIHGVDSFKLLKEINKQAAKHHRVIDCLLQARIAQEETKFGMPFDEINTLIESDQFTELQNIKIVGLMGMASFTDAKNQVKEEFESLASFFEKLKEKPITNNLNLTTLSMGMSGDYQIAVTAGSTMIRVGSAIFGARNYTE